MADDRRQEEEAWLMHHHPHHHPHPHPPHHHHPHPPPHQMQSDPNKPVWPSSPPSYNSDENTVSWTPTMDASQYPGYPSNYWYPQSHSTGHYASPAYPAGAEGQPPYNPQAMAAAYPNEHGVYSPGQGQYSASSFHPSNPFYCADHQMPQRQAAGAYPGQGGPPSGAYPGQGGPPSGAYPGQGVPPSEQNAGGSGQPHSQHHQHHHHYPGPHCQGGPGYPPQASYPHYGEGGHSHSMPPNPPYNPAGGQQCVHPRAAQQHHQQVEAGGGWSHAGGGGGYAPPPLPPSQQQQPPQWQPGQQQPPPPPQNHHYGPPPVRPAHPPAWPGTGTGAPPPYQPKDQQHQRNAPQAGPRPRLAPSPNPPNGKPAEFSSPPQMYSRTGRAAGPAEPNGSQADPPPPPPSGPASAQAPAPTQPQGTAGPPPQHLSDNPGLAKVQQVMARVQLLEEDVDEFVGKKSDKSYRYLEELLTKELLVLDSVETQGQDSVRQARKETVQRIQAILDRLEKKAF